MRVVFHHNRRLSVLVGIDSSIGFRALLTDGLHIEKLFISIADLESTRVSILVCFGNQITKNNCRLPVGKITSHFGM